MKLRLHCIALNFIQYNYSFLKLPKLKANEKIWYQEIFMTWMEGRQKIYLHIAFCTVYGILHIKILIFISSLQFLRIVPIVAYFIMLPLALCAIK